jgi:hypothetical protein
MPPLGRTLTAALAAALLVAPAATAQPIHLHPKADIAPGQNLSSLDARHAALRGHSPTSSLAGTTSATTVPGPPIIRPSGRPAERQGAFSDRRPSGRHSSAETDAYSGTSGPAPATVRTVNASSADGFAYGDAAIGAGIGGTLALLIAAGTVTIRRRRLQPS